MMTSATSKDEHLSCKDDPGYVQTEDEDSRNANKLDGIKQESEESTSDDDNGVYFLLSELLRCATTSV